MSNVIKIKNSAIAGRTPTTADIVYGELAINYHDGLMYYRRDNDIIDTFRSQYNISSKQLNRNTYTATDGQTLFSVNYTVNSSPFVFVYVNGVFIDPSEFTATSGNSITLATPAVAGDIVECIGYQIDISYNTTGTNSVNVTTESLNPAAGTTTLTLPTGYTPGNIIVTNNGVVLEPGVDYAATTSPTISLTNASLAGDSYVVYTFGNATRYSYNSYTLTPSSSSTTLNIPGGFIDNNILVIKNGAVLTSGLDYDSTTTPNITLTQPTFAGDMFVVLVFSLFSVANAVQKTGDTMSGPLALFAGSTTPTATTSAEIVNFGQLISNLYGLNGATSVTTPGTSLTSSMQGTLISFSGNSGSSFSVTLPSVSSVANFSALVLTGNQLLTNQVITIAAASGETTSTTSLNQYDTVVLVANYTSLRWDTIVYSNPVSPTFSSHVVANGNIADPVINAPVTITVGASPFTYTNASNYRGEVIVSAGTVSNVSVVRSGVTIDTGVTAGIVPVAPGDAVVVTYTSTPTMTFLSM